MRRLSLVTLALATTLTGCATVQPWERSTLSKPYMDLTVSTSSPFQDHVWQIREGAIGGAGGLGGGCGCN